MAGLLRVGDPAPEFVLMNQDRKWVRLSDYHGKRVILLFYPMDFSPTCTEEHFRFKTEMQRLQGDDNTIVFGVSCDSPYSHAAYKKLCDMPYDLLSDPTRKMVKRYGMWAGEDPYNCAKRGTIVIGPDGKIAFDVDAQMDQPRKVDDLAIAIETAEQQRATEFGVST